MTDREKNTVFIAVVLGCLLLMGGLRLTDRNLNRILVPEQEIESVSLEFDHGVTVRFGKQHWSLGTVSLFILEGDEETIILRIRGTDIKIPRFLPLGALSSQLRLTN